MSNQAQSPDTIRLPSLRSNVAALGMVQMSNYIIPLVTLPYLTRVLGVEAFGKFVFAQAFIVFFVMLVDFGFSLSATRKISALRTDKENLSRIFAATWAAQWLLVVLACCLVVSAVILTDRLRPDVFLYVATLSSVIGAALFPVWLLQGLERLQVVANIQLLSRLLGLVPIFILINGPEDTVWALLIQGVGSIIGGLLSLLWIRWESIIIWRFPLWSETIGALREGAVFFYSRAFISLYTTMVPLVLGWLAGPVVLASFVLADKVRSAAQSLLMPISQALYPRMSHLFSHDHAVAIALLKRSGVITLSIATITSLTLWLGADLFIHLLGGPGYTEAVNVLRWLAPVPFFIAVSNLFGVQVLLACGETRLFNITTSLIGLTVLVLVYPLIEKYSVQGAAALILMAEITVACVFFYVVFNDKKIKNKK